ncbi:protein adenylyltransferase SelO [Marinococcus sp. PL1-022]|uniref:protein adenylyltransferase SelO n=1 Tax=Marinococcus sp. PL1-022 TaxID=3095363 RepID=UPI0029C4728A|nr:YdiU family protein [Marinococcus sp. PL1-022]MDX6152224.1 YdiU family protein [Marinococcus sp. PL1-022]
MADENTVKQAGWQLEHSYAALPQTFFSKITPAPIQNPELIILNEQLADSLGLDSGALQEEEGVQILAGSRTPDSGLPLAQAYAGHQFGHFTMLGDGRALLHGEQITPDGRRIDIQLKGSGRTTYSRGGDGRAALGPMLREYIISEAMHALGIPTTRSLAVVKTGEPVFRESILTGAVLTRTASSHLRVGTFEYALNRGSMNDLRALADYTISRHYPEVRETENPYLMLLREVVTRQASLIAKWQLAGFIHGVMNSDNMALSGETIDYGPCAFMNSYDPKTVFSSIDARGRYAYGRQPIMAEWNLSRFAEALVPLIDENQEKAVELAQAEISSFPEKFNMYWLQGMRAKLGLFTEEAEDEALITDLLNLMQELEADYTNTFRALTFNKLDKTGLFTDNRFASWQERWQERLRKQNESQEDSRQLMRDNNPAVIPRNHHVEEALEAAEKNGDYSVMNKLLDVLADPYAHTREQEDYTAPPAPTLVPYRTYCGT